MTDSQFDQYLRNLSQGRYIALTGHSLTANQIELVRLELEKIKFEIDDYFKVIASTRLER